MAMGAAMPKPCGTRRADAACVGIERTILDPTAPSWHARVQFPPVALADEHGLVCLSDGLDAGLLWAGYQHGVFPWTDEPVGWFAPPKRGVLVPAQAAFPRNLPKLWRKGGFRVSFDSAFPRVIRGCRARHKEQGEWITPRFVAAYSQLHDFGHAHSVEVWRDNELVGGCYGVQVGSLLSAESMFGTVDNASRAALYALVQASDALGIELIDVQVINEVTARLGATQWSRQRFAQAVAAVSKRPGALLPARWAADAWTPPWAAGCCGQTAREAASRCPS